METGTGRIQDRMNHRMNKMFSKPKATLWNRVWQLTNAPIGAIRRNMRKILCALPLMALPAFSAMTGGCVQISAPDKPIVINLNVKIEHEVRVRVEKDLDQALSSNPALF